ncbi:hypothetical protein LCGC14_0740250 [marine sediment metagenome]|uniref:Uncharacterized protein n=1 Tax=marine sediment metagenome TaxID=412755 RepID=A0A0F9SRS5_9ZZZZ
MPKEIIWQPNPGAQTSFLSAIDREVLMGGAVSGGKTDGLWAAPLRWIWSPYHRAILFRREKDDLQEIIDRTRMVYNKICPGAKWVSSRSRWEFPTGAKIWMGSSELAKDIEAWKTFEFNFIGFDELTTFEKSQYLYMLSRNRNKVAASLPYQMRSGTNPDGLGHEWVFKRFVDGKTPYVSYRYISEVTDPKGRTTELELTRKFIPATIFDNPAVGDRDAYIAGLQQLGEGLADALIYGRWDYFRGQMFPRSACPIPEVPPEIKSQDHYVIRALDYGWTDPTVVQWWIVYPNLYIRPVLELAHEVKIREASIPTIVHLMRKAEERLASKNVNMPVRLPVIDPSTKQRDARDANRSIKDLFEENGLWFNSAITDRAAGWAYIRTLMENKQVCHWKGQGGYLISTIYQLVRRPGTEDIKDKQNDHSADTFRYAAMAFYEGTGQAIGSEQEKLSGKQDQYYPQLMKRLQEAQRGTSLNLGDGF